MEQKTLVLAEGSATVEHKARDHRPHHERYRDVGQVRCDIDSKKIGIDVAQPTDHDDHAQGEPELAEPRSSITATDVVPRQHRPDAPCCETSADIGNANTGISQHSNGSFGGGNSDLEARPRRIKCLSGR